MKFSLVLASRDRIKLLKSLIQSVEKTADDLTNIEFVVVADDDDPITKNYRPDKDINYTLISRPRSEWMHRDYINFAYPHCNGKYIIVLNDDTLFMTPSWDQIDIPEDINFGFINTFSGDKCCCFPLLSRKAIDNLGFIMPNERKSWGADHDMFWIFNSPGINSITRLPMCIIHDSVHSKLRTRDHITDRMEYIFDNHKEIKFIDFYADRFISHLEKEIDKSPKDNLYIYLCDDNAPQNFKDINKLMKKENSKVVIVGIFLDEEIKKIIHETYGTNISYAWIDDSINIDNAINKTIKKCKILGNFKNIYFNNNQIKEEDGDDKYAGSFFPQLEGKKILKSPKITCIIANHFNLKEAIKSIMDQDMKEWQLIVNGNILENLPVDHRILYIHNNMKKSWNFNDCRNKGLVKGKLITYLTDNDILYPNAFSTFVNYVEKNPECFVMYGSIDVSKNGSVSGEKRAIDNIDNHNPHKYHPDYLQVCHKSSILKYWNDNEYAGFEFAENLRLGENCGNLGFTMHAIDVKIGQKRIVFND